MTTTADLYIAKQYAAGIGHIEAREDGRFLVSYYFRRCHVRQTWADTLQSARFALRRLARDAR